MNSKSQIPTLRVKACTYRLGLVAVLLLLPKAKLLAQWPTADDFNPRANNWVYVVALQPDGKILVGGSFTTIGGQSRSCLARLNPDGTVDPEFNPGASGGPLPQVFCLAVQPDGKILVGGMFDNLGGQSRTNLGRLNPDGTVDLTALFDTGPTDRVDCLAFQSDGRILVGGEFSVLAGASISRIARLNTDSTVDLGFNPGADQRPYSIVVQPDGKIVVGGRFTTLAGQTRSYIGRLNPDGSLDSSFDPGADAIVRCIALQPDGKILVGGEFGVLAGQSRQRIGRLNPDGSLDESFNPGADRTVYCFALQSDGKILVGGAFTNLAGQNCPGLGRLNPDGTLDPDFNPGADGAVFSLALQSDGKVVVGGVFKTLAGQSRTNIGRLHNTALATDSLTFDAWSITWLRGGTCPELCQATFEVYSQEGNLIFRGKGTRMPGGWRLADLSLAANIRVRAWGYTSGGQYHGSAWFTEQWAGLPYLVRHPESRTELYGSAARFSASAKSGTALSYQWFKDGVPLQDGDRVSGAVTSTLTLSNLAGADAGRYWVVASNQWGSVTSRIALLTVADPWMSRHPQSTNRNVGDSVTLTVTAVGTEPLSYQWYHDGSVIQGATASNLTLTNLQGGDIGRYWVVVTNLYGAATSAVALLAVNVVTADPGFDPGADGEVHVLALQSDDKILVGGSFRFVHGWDLPGLARLAPDGTVDASIDLGEYNTSISSVAVQRDGKIVVGGTFNSLGGQSRSNIARLNPDGTLDPGFSPGADRSVTCLALQPDGRILVGGSFTNLAGQRCLRIGRLNPDGTIDPSFQSSADDIPSCIVVQPDGKILVGGWFGTLGGQPLYCLGRLNPDGSLDGSFNPRPSGRVRSLALQSDGKILVGGQFTTLAGKDCARIGRLNPDGTLDPSFNPGASGAIFSLAVQSDGKILVGGLFTILGGESRSNIARLFPDGTVDLSFNPGANRTVNGIALQPDGSILVGGAFTVLAGQSRQRIGRLNNTEPATESLSFDGSSITWLRGGTSPEVWRTSFDFSTNGTDWVSLGQGTRIPGGWRLTGVGLPANGFIRARGYVCAGDGADWFVESVAPATASIRVSLVRDGAEVVLSWTGGRGPYQVQQNTDLGNPNGWTDLGEPVLTNWIVLPIRSGNVFLRVRGQ
jgi:uncharacterized delta-60 repeat protein